MINKDHAVFLSLISGTRRAGTRATGVEAVVADTGKIEIKDISEIGRAHV